MNLTKNKFNQIFFFLFLFLGSVFNGSNSKTLVLINFIIFFCFLCYLFLSKNNISVTKYLINRNKNLFFLFIVFILYLFLQLIPLPFGWLNFFSNSYYLYLNKINISTFKAISLDPINTLVEIINYLNIFMIVIITNL